MKSKLYEGKTLLFLGGLALEIEAVEKAKALGARTIVADYYQNAPAKAHADLSVMTSATDIDGLVTLCHEEHVDGVFTGYADVLLPYYAELCNRLGYPCYGSAETFSLMVDKRRFKQACRQFGVPVVEEYSDYDVRSGRVKYPILIKPTDSSGSRGISVVTSFEEYGKAIERALGYSKSGDYLIERYMTGDEVVLYYYMQNGNPVFQGMCDRFVFKNVNHVAQIPTAYVYPSRYTKKHIEGLNETIIAMLRGIGMSNGPLFLQAFVENGVAVLYEPGYRLCGAREHVLVSSLNGIDSEEMLIHFALTGRMSDKNIEFVSDPFFGGRYGCKLSPILKQGHVAHIEGVDKVIANHNVVALFLNNEVGDDVSEENVGTLRQLAYRAYITADSLMDLACSIEDVQGTLRYMDSEGDSMILAGFDTSLLECGL